MVCLVCHLYAMLYVVSCCVVFFFFFKQKTAYEMRISDWSSDVCSSDLGSILVTSAPLSPSSIVVIDPATPEVRSSTFSFSRTAAIIAPCRIQIGSGAG